MKSRDTIIMELLNSASSLCGAIKSKKDASVFGYVVKQIMAVAINNDGTVYYCGWLRNNSETWDATRILDKVMCDYNREILEAQNGV